jgi:tRNA1(Val) A37 N6-methylase TrmN6
MNDNALRFDRVNDDIRLIQIEDGLTFGTDALLLAGYIDRKYKTAIELGTGTGIISMLLLTREKVLNVTALEVQEEYAILTERNAQLNDLSDRLRTVNTDLREYKGTNDFDIVYSNPPYMKTNAGRANLISGKNIARHEVCGDIGDFCAAAARILKHGGNFYTVWRPDRLTDLMFALRSNRLEPKLITFVHATPESQPSIVLIRSKKGAASGCTLTRPLFLHKNAEDAKANVLSPDAEAIYATCSFESFK